MSKDVQEAQFSAKKKYVEPWNLPLTMSDWNVTPGRTAPPIWSPPFQDPRPTTILWARAVAAMTGLPHCGTGSMTDRPTVPGTLSDCSVDCRIAFVFGAVSPL
jgi:hypothetical protein